MYDCEFLTDRRSIERVDTRVLQVIYEIMSGNVPLFVGQQMDVFIEAPMAGVR